MIQFIVRIGVPHSSQYWVKFPQIGGSSRHDYLAVYWNVKGQQKQTASVIGLTELCFNPYKPGVLFMGHRPQNVASYLGGYSVCLQEFH